MAIVQVNLQELTRKITCKRDMYDMLTKNGKNLEHASSLKSSATANLYLPSYRYCTYKFML